MFQILHFYWSFLSNIMAEKGLTPNSWGRTCSRCCKSRKKREVCCGVLVPTCCSSRMASDHWLWRSRNLRASSGPWSLALSASNHWGKVSRNHLTLWGLVTRLLVYKQQPNACCGWVSCMQATPEHSLWPGYSCPSNGGALTMAGLLVCKQRPSACCGLVTFIRVTARHSLWLGYFDTSNSQTYTVAGLHLYE